MTAQMRQSLIPWLEFAFLALAVITGFVFLADAALHGRELMLTGSGITTSCVAAAYVVNGWRK